MSNCFSRTDSLLCSLVPHQLWTRSSIARLGCLGAMLLRVEATEAGSKLSDVSASTISIGGPEASRLTQDSSSLLAIRVVDQNGAPVDAAEILIVKPGRRLRTDAAGLAVVPIAVGSYALEIRRLGFLPRTVSVATVSSSGAAVAIRMVRLESKLAPVLTRSSRLGLSGFVSDTALRPLDKAKVHVAGGGRMVKSDDSGRFHMDLKSGSYLVHVEADSFVRQIVAVNIPKDSGRELAIQMPRITKENRAAFIVESVNLFELDRRMLRASPSMTRYFTRDQLMALGIVDMADLVRRWATRSVQAECSVSVTESGSPYAMPVGSVQTIDVEFVEVYLPSVALKSSPRGQTSINNNTTRFTSQSSGVHLANRSCGDVGVIVWPRK